MRIKIIVVGKTKERYLFQGEQEFLERLKPFAQVEIVVLKDEAITKSIPGEKVMKKEGERILRALRKDDFVIALDREGEMLSSEGIAAFLEKRKNTGESNLVFIIGGALGLSPEVLEKANFQLSLSSLTFTHQMTRLILLEQIYRVFSILAGTEYHK
ncbi:MAG TPA: 23S rRNA (pseudouridine(1915)-N(3))-methyltransferase RlmH [Candidatus Peregrinibacteria bacterium]|nr:23S rRNA (pseudouridine(1915)-N(3))-methyltransferase RlmH [Candidatus Peregrinibacteria bacterium]